MRKKINTRLLGIAIFSIIFTMIIMTSVFYSKLKVQTFSDLEVIANILSNENKVENDFKNLRVTVVDRDGTVIYDSYYDAKRLGNHMDRPEIDSAKKNGIGKAIRKSDTLSASVFYFAKRMKDGRVIRVGKEAHSVVAVLISAAPMILFLSLILLAICLYISHILTLNLIKPVVEMSKDMDNIQDNVYVELQPFIRKIQNQHEEIISAANLRQEFTANVTHELKTPLTAISGYAEIMENGIAKEDQIKHFSSEIRKSAARLLILINDIMKLAQLDSGSKEEFLEDVDLSEIARDSVEMLSIRGEKENIKIFYDGMEEIKVKLGKEFAQELVYNLIENAIRYNKQGGSVMVRVYRQGDKNFLSVEDTGIGIPKEHQGRIFERFYRVDKSRSKKLGGTGLGLAIVKHICVHTGGELSLNSKVGVGTRIDISWKNETD